MSTEAGGSLESAAPAPVEREETGFFSSYAEFAKTLRTWLVAYGIGGPVLLLTHKELTDVVIHSGKGQRIAALFLIGVAFQVIAAVTYKMCMWYLYLGELKPALRKTARHRVSVYVSEAFGLELFFDFGTIGCFAVATFILSSIFLW